MSAAGIGAIALVGSVDVALDAATIISAGSLSLSGLNMRKVREMVYNEKHKQKSIERNWFLR